MSQRTVIRSDRLRGDEFVQEVIDLLGLPDRTADYQVVHPLSQGSDGEIFKLFIGNVPHVVKLYKTGLNSQYVKLQRVLLENKDKPEAKRHAGYEAVYFSAVPVGWVTHMGKKGLVFRYVVQPRQARLPTARDRAQVRAQMKFLHWLGFCHLDITKRNILLALGDKCYLMDFDFVCEIGRSPLGPLPPESSEPILRRDPADVEDDTHLWQLLQGDYFKHLPAEVDENSVELVPANYRPSIPADVLRAEEEAARRALDAAKAERDAFASKLAKLKQAEIDAKRAADATWSPLSSPLESKRLEFQRSQQDLQGWKLDRRERNWDTVSGVKPAALGSQLAAG